MNFVLSIFIFNLFKLIHCSIALSALFNLLSYYHHYQHKLCYVSFGNIFILPLSEYTFIISFMYIINNKGSKTGPWGIPYSLVNKLDHLLLNLTICVLLLDYEFNHSNTILLIPYWYNFRNNLSLSIVLKTHFRSMNITPIIFPSLTINFHSSMMSRSTPSRSLLITLLCDKLARPRINSAWISFMICASLSNIIRRCDLNLWK